MEARVKGGNYATKVLNFAIKDGFLNSKKRIRGVARGRSRHRQRKEG